MIYGVEHEGKIEYVISNGGGYLPGAYDSKRAAKYAFRFSREDLHEIWSKANNKAISFEQLQEFKKKKMQHKF